MEKEVRSNKTQGRKRKEKTNRAGERRRGGREASVYRAITDSCGPLMNTHTLTRTH